MTALVVTRNWHEKVFRKVQSLVEKAADSAAQTFLINVFQTTQIEDGHAHRAWLQAGIEAIGPMANAAFQQSGVPRNRLSDDPIAFSSGRGIRKTSRLHCEILIGNGLDFVKVLEFGGVLEPIEPGGRKLNPVRRPPKVGPLYGPRSGEGRGMLVWTDEAGVTHRAPFRRYSPGRHVGRAIRISRKMLKSRGVR